MENNHVSVCIDVLCICATIWHNKERMMIIRYRIKDGDTMQMRKFKIIMGMEKNSGCGLTL